MDEVRENTPTYSDPPQMSEVSTILNIFFEPGRVFEDLKRKPRFLIGLLLISLLSGLVTFALYQKLGETGVRAAVNQQFDQNPQTASMPPEQRRAMVEFNMTIQRYMPVVFVVVILIFTFVLGLFYFLGAKAFGGNGGFMHAVSVVVYSSIPPAVVGTIAALLVLALKSADDIDMVSAQRGGLVPANPTILFDGKAQPVLAAILSSVDLFQIWGWVLAAIGLKITNRISTGSAAAVVIIFALIGVLLKVVGAFFS